MPIFTRLKKYFISLLILSLLCGCTTNNNLYTGEDNLKANEEFSVLNTILLPVAIVAIVAMAYGASQGSSGGSVSCHGSYCNENAAWDYLPGSSQYRCRATSNGQFVNNTYCAYQFKQDNWY